jgi:hypothetical protein
MMSSLARDVSLSGMSNVIFKILPVCLASSQSRALCTQQVILLAESTLANRICPAGAHILRGRHPGAFCVTPASARWKTAMLSFNLQCLF